MAKLKVAGTWAGVVEVELEKWTVPMLREEVAKRSNCAPDAINLICAGKVLKDGHGTENLSELGIRNNSKILSSRVSVENAKSLRDEALAEEDRSRRLARVKAAATALAKRHANGSMPVEDFNIELEDQSGKKVNLGSETDQRAVMMGLMLHANGKQLIRKQKYADALEVLAMGEESFSLCDPKVIEMVDNVPILQIDMVWCYFMLRDISSLSLAGVRLCKAREGIERAHGKDYSRVRLLQGGRYPEIALHLRLELLEGVVAYHSGHFDQSRNALTSAQAKFFKLQVPDEALCQVISMGFQKHDAMRALRMNNQDVGGAVDFLVEEKAKRLRKREEDSKRQQEIMEQKSYGVTPLEKAVDLQRLNELVSIGYEKALAAEALRRNENDTQKALDDLTNPETNASIQNDIESRKRKRQRKAEDNVIKQLLSMGFDRSRVEEAVRAGGTVEGAMQLLISESMPNQPSDANVSSTSASAVDNTDPADANTIDYAGDISTDVGLDDRDIEMEGEIADELSNTDAFSDYDIDVMKEGEAIEEYLALLASADSSN